MHKPVTITTRSQNWLLLVWLVFLVLTGWAIQRHLKVSADLRLFLPTPQTAQEKLLLEGLGSGPASRLVLVSVEGPDTKTLALASRSLAAKFRASPVVAHVLNGDGSEQMSIPSNLLPLRYLFTDTPLNEGALITALSERVTDLASPIAPLVEELLPRDPTLTTLKLVDAWTPQEQPASKEGVWFTSDGRRAIQLLELSLTGFDADAQGRSLSALQAGVTAAHLPAEVRVQFTGPAAFSALMRNRTEREANWIGAIDSLGLVTLLLLAYRRWRWVLLGALPLGTAGVAGLAAVAAIFGEAHGITLAFGFTLIGVVQDYPLHLFSHLHPRTDATHEARRLWPTLATGVASTCVAYLAFALAGVKGLSQLACFTITGLATAALVTRWLVPALTGTALHDPAASHQLATAWKRVAAIPRPKWALAVVLAAASLAILRSPAPLWEDNLGALTPVPKPLIQLDSQLRKELGAPDVRYMLAVNGPTAEDVLQQSEQMVPQLEAWKSAGTISGYDLSTRYLPSIATQRLRQAKLPQGSVLASQLTAASEVEGSFAAETFTPFLEDVEVARTAAPITPETIRNTPLGSRVAALLLQRDAEWSALVTLAGVRDPAALRAGTNGPQFLLLDLKTASTGLVIRQRQQIVKLLAAAGLLVLVVVWLSLRDIHRVWRVVAPMAATTLVIMGVLQAMGISMTLFHLIALVLAAGLGLDYALFFERPAEDFAEQCRTFHAVLICSATTLLVFALLAFSSLPVLRGIGLTVAIGVVSNFILAILVSRPDAALSDSPEASSP